MVLEKKMKAEVLLSVAVPTYNRNRYLQDLLPSLIGQCAAANAKGYLVELLVSDNASTDGSGKFVSESFFGLSFAKYYKNESNCGGDRNFIKCVERACGKYVWIFGDDEMLGEDAVSRVCCVLTREQPALIISKSEGHLTKRYNSYRKAIVSGLIGDIAFPLHHTLITANVFRKGDFDMEYGQLMLPTSYAHMYALSRALSRPDSKTIIFSKSRSAFFVRKERAPFAEAPSNLGAKVTRYCFDLADSLNSQALRLAMIYYFRIQNKLAGKLNVAKRGVKYVLYDMRILH